MKVAVVMKVSLSKLSNIFAEDYPKTRPMSMMVRPLQVTRNGEFGPADVTDVSLF